MLWGSCTHQSKESPNWPKGHSVNSLWLSNAIWHWESWSMWVQIMAWCLVHQCWPIIKCILCHSPESNLRLLSHVQVAITSCSSRCSSFLWLHWSIACKLSITTKLSCFPDDIFKCLFLNENVWITIKILLNFVPQGPIYNIPEFVQIMAWRRPGGKPLSEPMLVYWGIYALISLSELKALNKAPGRQFCTHFRCILWVFCPWERFQLPMSSQHWEMI